jgi:hypothetical protein
VDWAFPALFMAEKVGPGYSPVRAEAARDRTREEIWIDNFDLNLVPVFCGRNDFFKAYHGFFDPDPKRVLAVIASGEAGVGRTRLLQELAKQMLRDGHVPIMLTSDGPKWQPPQTVRALGDQLSKAIRKARRDLGLGAEQESQLNLLLYPPAERGAGQAALDRDIELELGADGAITAVALRMSLQRDLFRLMKDVRERYDPVVQAHGRAIVLLDSVERYEDLLDEMLGRMLDAWGLGTCDESIPVVLAFAMRQPANTKVGDALERASHKGWLNQLPLTPFNLTTDEDLLAYSWIVLNPFNKRYPELFSHQRHVLNDMASPDVVSMARSLMKDRFAGLPRNLANAAELYSLTKAFRDGHFVLPLDSDDEDAQTLAAARVDPGLLQ